MQLNEIWQDLGAAGAVIQKTGRQTVQLVYAASLPAGNQTNSFAVRHLDPAVFPSVGGDNLYIRAAQTAYDQTVSTSSASATSIV